MDSRSHLILTNNPPTTKRRVRLRLLSSLSTFRGSAAGCGDSVSLQAAELGLLIYQHFLSPSHLLTFPQTCSSTFYDFSKKKKRVQLVISICRALIY